jgi:hypothetical protein
VSGGTVHRLPVPLAAAIENLLDYLDALDQTRPLSPGGDRNEPDDAA